MNYKTLYEEALGKLSQLEITCRELIKENELLKGTSIISIKPEKLSPAKSGNIYEKKIFNIIKDTYIENVKFIAMDETELGGSSANIDLKCVFNKKIIGIEAKKCNTPDWMQCSLKYKNNKWEGSQSCKIPIECKNIFNMLIKDINIYDGEIPPFINNKITHDEWLEIKKTTNKWNDIYVPIPSDIIKKLYSLKECHYIQISDYGLYHLGEDVCNFNVPEFIIDQQLRIRTKIHSRKNKKGFCDISVIASCQPIDIKKLTKSPYSLDMIDNLPRVLNYKY